MPIAALVATPARRVRAASAVHAKATATAMVEARATRTAAIEPSRAPRRRADAELLGDLGHPQQPTAIVGSNRVIKFSETPADNWTALHASARAPPGRWLRCRPAPTPTANSGTTRLRPSTRRS